MSARRPTRFPTCCRRRPRASSCWATSPIPGPPCARGRRESCARGDARGPCCHSIRCRSIEATDLQVLVPPCWTVATRRELLLGAGAGAAGLALGRVAAAAGILGGEPDHL